MKKLSVLLLAVLLVACGGGTSTTGEGKTEANDKGEYSTAKVTVKDGKITEVTLDSMKDVDGELKSKKELKDEYQMKAASEIKKEWYEQAEFLEKKIVEKGVDGIKVDEKGYPTDADVLAGCTMNVKGLLEATEAAQEAAK